MHKFLLPLALLTFITACGPAEAPPEVNFPDLSIDASQAPNRQTPANGNKNEPSSETTPDAKPSAEVIPGAELIPVPEIKTPSEPFGWKRRGPLKNNAS